MVLHHPIVSQNSWEGRQPRYSSRNVADAASHQDPEPGGSGGPRERGGGGDRGRRGNAAGVLQSDALGADDAGKGLLINGARFAQPYDRINGVLLVKQL